MNFMRGHSALVRAVSRTLPPRALDEPGGSAREQKKSETVQPHIESIEALDFIGFSRVFERIDKALLDAIAQDDALDIARISREDRVGYMALLAGEDGSIVERRVMLGGGLRYRATSRLELPCVGDWVVLRWPDPRHRDASAQAMIWQMLPRSGCFVRQAAGERTEPQVIAANLDVLFIVTSPNAEFEPRRLERYLLMAKESGATPVVVLNKVDLVDDPAPYLQQIGALTREPLAALTTSSLTGEVAAMRPWLGHGVTCALVGSSGVGKSTITNALSRSEAQPTAAIREDDDEGRHTTTARHMIMLPDDLGVLIDTPGMRELQLWSGAASERLEGMFDEIATLAGACRFRDCQHVDEPGCAVLDAVDDGQLSAGRLASWRKLGRELEWHKKRQDVAELRSESKKRGKMIRQIVKHRKKR